MLFFFLGVGTRYSPLYGKFTCGPSSSYVSFYSSNSCSGSSSASSSLDSSTICGSNSGSSYLYFLKNILFIFDRESYMLVCQEGRKDIPVVNQWGTTVACATIKYSGNSCTYNNVLSIEAVEDPSVDYNVSKYNLIIVGKN